jgi:predicted RNA-binding Zn-ribbon protein involved in translation (DUF1610 family)
MPDPDDHTWQCPNCNEQVDDTLEVCWQCGCNWEGKVDPDFQPIFKKQTQTICDHCGFALQDVTALQCPECGHEIKEIQAYSNKGSSLPSRSFFLHAWGLLWLFGPIVAIFCAVVSMIGGGSAFAAVFLTIIMLAIAAPILFVIRALLDIPMHKKQPTDQRALNDDRPQ